MEAGEPCDVGALTRAAEQIAVEIAAGAQAHALITRKCGKERREILDVAQVRVLEAHVAGRHNVYRVTVESCRSVVAGREIEVTRAELFARASRSEQAALFRLVRFVWGGGYRGQQNYRGGRR